MSVIRSNKACRASVVVVCLAYHELVQRVRKGAQSEHAKASLQQGVPPSNWTSVATDAVHNGRAVDTPEGSMSHTIMTMIRRTRTKTIGALLARLAPVDTTHCRVETATPRTTTGTRTKRTTMLCIQRKRSAPSKVGQEAIGGSRKAPPAQLRGVRVDQFLAAQRPGTTSNALGRPEPDRQAFNRRG